MYVHCGIPIICINFITIIIINNNNLLRTKASAIHLPPLLSCAAGVYSLPHNFLISPLHRKGLPLLPGPSLSGQSVTLVVWCMRTLCIANEAAHALTVDAVKRRRASLVKRAQSLYCVTSVTVPAFWVSWFRGKVKALNSTQPRYLLKAPKVFATALLVCTFMPMWWVCIEDFHGSVLFGKASNAF